MKLRFTKTFDAEYAKLIRRNEPLKQKIKKQLELLLVNPNHPSLRLHKIQKSNFKSISVDKSVRILFIFEKHCVTVFHIGKHEDVYR
ncbi:MAG TPA: type II toxin-antitoxin system RelE/ParE family toxin [Candidatus Woesebacteria bacterium]|nr:type II toxin-antitoxin system RelE/ParE family toxin [Candidatus Woesebacteria bacterium]